jgi:hypothetical protein
VRVWRIHLYGFDIHTVVARTRGAAKYADWKRAREAGYFTGPDGFFRYLINCWVEEERP